MRQMFYSQSASCRTSGPGGRTSAGGRCKCLAQGPIFPFTGTGTTQLPHQFPPMLKVPGAHLLRGRPGALHSSSPPGPWHLVSGDVRYSEFLVCRRNSCLNVPEWGGSRLKGSPHSHRLTGCHSLPLPNLYTSQWLPCTLAPQVLPLDVALLPSKPGWSGPVGASRRRRGEGLGCGPQALLEPCWNLVRALLTTPGESSSLTSLQGVRYDSSPLGHPLFKGSF